MSTHREVFIDGIWFDYSLCSSTTDAYRKVESRIYLGSGYHVKINGIHQEPFEEKHYFWWCATEDGMESYRSILQALRQISREEV